jgi:hypothetical protein
MVFIAERETREETSRFEYLLVTLNLSLVEKDVETFELQRHMLFSFALQ